VNESPQIEARHLFRRGKSSIFSGNPNLNRFAVNESPQIETRHSFRRGKSSIFSGNPNLNRFAVNESPQIETRHLFNAPQALQLFIIIYSLLSLI